MDESEDYLRHAYPRDKHELLRIEDLLEEVWPLFEHSYVADKGWPYEIKDGTDLQRDFKPSSSTNAMILFAMAIAMGGLDESCLFTGERRRRLPIEANKLAQSAHPEFGPILRQAFKKLTSDSLRLQTEWTGKLKVIANIGDAQPPLFRSSYFGDDDIFTLTWTYHLCAVTDHDQPYMKALEDAAIRAVKRALEAPHKPQLRFLSETTPGKVRPSRMDHAFCVLRAMGPIRTPVFREWGLC